MPALQPIVLTLPGPVVETYDPASLSSEGAEFVDSAPDMMYDARIVRVKVRPAGAGNTGRTSEHLGVRPIPLVLGDGIDVTKPEGNTFRLTTMIRKTSSKAQAEELVEMIKAYVASADFKEVVTSSSYY